jgi:uncharacterized protein
MPALDITPRLAPGRQRIESYGGGGFRIAGVRYRGSVIVRPERTEPWSMTSADLLGAASLEPVLADVETGLILLVGCGASFFPTPVGLAAALGARGARLEWMATGAACRTFNVLLSEGRPIAAALIAVD